MNANRIALLIAAVLLLCVGAVVARGVSEPATAPPSELPTAAAPSPPPAPRRGPPGGEPDQERDGVRFLVLKQGEGEPAGPADLLVLHYATWLTDGTPVESSRIRGRPLTIALGSGRLYPGLETLLAGMKKGESRKGVIPPELAFGAEGRGRIPPDATLVIVAEVLEVKPPE